MQIMTPAQPGSTVKDQNGTPGHPNGFERTAHLSTELKNNNGYRKAPEHDVYGDVNDITSCNEDEAKDSVAAKGVRTEMSHADSTVYTDKNILESDLPELIVCYKDSSFHAVKDICVDEGMPAENKCATQNLLQNNNLKHADVTEEANPDISYEDDFKPSSYKDLKGNAAADGVNKGKVNLDKDPAYDSDSIEIESSPNSDKYQDSARLQISKSPIQRGEDECNQDSEADTYTSYEDDFKSSSYKHLKENADADGVNKGEVNLDKDPAYDSDSIELESSPNFYKYQDTASRQTSKSPIQRGEDECNAVEKTTEIVCDSTPLGEGLHSETSLERLLKSARGGENNSSQQSDQLSGAQAQSPVMTEETNLSSLDDLLDGGVISFKVESSKLAPITIDEIDKNTIGQQLKSEKKLIHDDGIADNRLVINDQIKRDQGESSFSVAGPLPDVVPYSGHIPFSGSISLRSDSSTTSTRSFAFPVLPNEWNSSPVRMAKADRRNLRRRRGCIFGLLCCRF